MPAAKKHPSTRARRNTASTAATLTTDAPARKVPALPGRSDDQRWHPAVLEFWRDVWSSPMAAEFHESDIHQLVLLAYLTHDFYAALSATGRKEAATEIRLQRAMFGLTPYDRRRLEWTIETAEGAKAQGRRRRAAEPAPAAPKVTPEDPRAGLRVV
jgi:hypothetical protein